jgi:DNA gyrase subunit B
MPEENPSQETPKIPYLSPREHIRRRPGMYFGGNDLRAMHRLIDELVINAINQYMKGNLSQVEVILHEDSKVTVADDGLGIPVVEYKDTGKTIFEMIASEVGGESYFEEYEFRGGLFAVGLAAVNAASSSCDIYVKRDGFLWHLAYAQGIKQTGLTKVRPLRDDETTGTTVTFAPDFEVFDKNTFQYDRLAEHLRKLAYLVRDLRISLVDERKTQQKSAHFHFPEGLAAYVTHLNRDDTPIHDILHSVQEIDLSGELTGQQMKVEVAIQYIEQPQTIVLGFVNLYEPTGGGVHTRALLDAIERALNNFAYETGALLPDYYNVFNRFSEYDITNALTAVIHIWHPEPQFKGSTKYKLINPDIYKGVERVVYQMLKTTLEQDEATMHSILDRLLESKAIRDKRRQSD